MFENYDPRYMSWPFYKSILCDRLREKKGNYVNEQLFLCTAIVCLFLNLIVFLFYITQFIVASYKHPPSEQLNEKKNNLAGQKIRQLNFDLSKLSSDEHWIFGHWIDWLTQMQMSSF